MNVEFPVYPIIQLLFSYSFRDSFPMDREEARARMLRLWMTLSSSAAGRTSILTTER